MVWGDANLATAYVNNLYAECFPKKIAKYEFSTENFRYVQHQVPETPNLEKAFIIDESFYYFPLQSLALQENMVKSKTLCLRMNVLTLERIAPQSQPSPTFVLNSIQDLGLQ